MIRMTALRNVVRSFSSGDLAITRRGSTEVNAQGRRVDGPAFSVAGVRGSVWPVSAFDVRNTADGQVLEGEVTVFCLSPLRTANDGSGVNGDLVNHEGNEYEVIHAEQWTHGGFFAYRARLVSR